MHQAAAGLKPRKEIHQCGDGKGTVPRGSIAEPSWPANPREAQRLSGAFVIQHRSQRADNLYQFSLRP